MSDYRIKVLEIKVRELEEKCAAYERERETLYEQIKQLLMK